MGETRKMVLIVEYKGTAYHGFQLQADVPTVQGEMERALQRLTGNDTRVMAASRTDAGVHARGQVVSFRTEAPFPPRTFVSGLNYYLPGDIAVKAAYRVEELVNVRRDAVSREYHYYILNSPTRSPLKDDFSYRVSASLDIESMNRACEMLVGKHDFSSFASSVDASLKSAVRDVHRAAVEVLGEMVVFQMVASSFLTHQVRNTVGALLCVGRGRMSLDEFRDIIEAREYGLAGPMAPACGLCLMQINYPWSWGERDNENL